MAQNINDLELLNEFENCLAELFKLYCFHINVMNIFADEYFSRCKIRKDIHLSINIANEWRNYAWDKRVSLNNKLTNLKNDLDDNKDMKHNLKIIIVQVQLDFDKAVAHEKKIDTIVDNLKTEYNTASNNVHLLDCCLNYLEDRVKIILNKKDSLTSHIACIKMKYPY